VIARLSELTCRLQECGIEPSESVPIAADVGLIEQIPTKFLNGEVGLAAVTRPTCSDKVPVLSPRAATRSWTYMIQGC
jgi:hypothetical protein